MATSGSYDYSRTAAQVIQTAFEDLGVYAPGATIASADSTLALTRLNLLAKRLQVQTDISPGLKVWSRQRVVLFLANGQQKYVVGPGSSDARATTAYGRTTIDVAEAASQTTLSVTATTDTTTDPGTTLTMTAADLIGVEQDDATMHWSTIASVSAGDTVTIDDATSAAAAVGNYVYWFTSRAQRFAEIESAVIRDENLNDSELLVYRDVREYELAVADKYADGQPTAILVEPLLTQTRVTLNSQPSRVDRQIVMTVLYPAEDYDATTDTLAFPQEAFDYLCWALAKRLAPSKGRPWTAEMQSNYNDALMAWRGINPEVSNAYFMANPDY